MSFQYLGINLGTVTWLNEKPKIREAFAEAVLNPAMLQALEAGRVSIGPFNLAPAAGGKLLTAWNVDYRTATGEDGLGFIRLGPPHGLLSDSAGSTEATLERMLFAIHQRLLNRLFDRKYYFNRLDNGVNKLSSPRTQDGQNRNICFIEKTAVVGRSAVKAILLFGPDFDWDRVAESVDANQLDLTWLVAGYAAASASAQLAREVLGLKKLREAIMPLAAEATEGIALTSKTRKPHVGTAEVYQALSHSYDEWIAPDSTLAPEQRAILDNDAIRTNPVRIIGPAGSGKTLLMQLLAMKLLRMTPQTPRILYVTHNAPMEVSATERLTVLGGEHYRRSAYLQVSTLARYMGELTEIPGHQQLDPDPEKAKAEQSALLTDATEEMIAKRRDIIEGSTTLQSLTRDDSTKRYLVELIRSDISVAIKGRDLSTEPDAYVGSEVALGRLHSMLTREEREFVFDVFLTYQRELEKFGVLDADDVALTLLSSLRAPKWRNLQRRIRGFDFVFVDEAQLFNENECQVFALLTKGDKTYTPVVLALDEGQQLYRQVTSGLAMLGLKDVQRNSLNVTHRLTLPIAKIAYLALSGTSELFTEDFPDFTGDVLAAAGDGEDSAIPLLHEVPFDRLSRAIKRIIRSGRGKPEGMRQFAVVCHAAAYYPALVEGLTTELKDLDFVVLRERGQRPAGHAFVVLGTPEMVGGQEFDVVVSVGLEDGIVPPKLPDNPIMEQALEQQSKREMYLVFSRARHELHIVNAAPAKPNSVLSDAVARGFLKPAPVT